MTILWSVPNNEIPLYIALLEAKLHGDDAGGDDPAVEDVFVGGQEEGVKDGSALVQEVGGAVRDAVVLAKGIGRADAAIGPQPKRKVNF